MTAGLDSTISVGNGNDTVVVAGGTDASITIGSGNDNISISGGSQNTIKITGSSPDTVSDTDSNDKITFGDGPDRVAAGNGSTIIGGNGPDTVTAGNNSTVTLGTGPDTVYMGASNTVTVGTGSDTFVVGTSGVPILSAPASLTVNEDGSVTVPISATVLAGGFGHDVITGFTANKDVLQFSTSQFANMAAVLADAQQVGQNTVITLDSSDTITLVNVTKTSLNAKDFAFTSGAPNGSGTVSVTISGIPSHASLSGSSGPLTIVNGSVTLTSAQLVGLTLKAGEVTSGNVTVTATNTTTGASVSQTIALTVNPVAPTLTAPTTLAVNAGASVALGIGETPFDPRDTISLTITGVPSDATLSAGTKNANGSWTLTPAQLSGLMLNAGQAAVTTLTVTATNTQGVTASTSDNIALTINPVLTVGVSVVGNGSVQECQTLVATATISGDTADAGATINYQWQSSSDGVHWTNVGGALAGNFANGQLSSFLQLTEANEGQEFRAIASFTNSANNVITTTSTATVPVADVTPEITIPFSYAVDDLSIVKTVSGTPTQVYNDTFGTAPITSPTILSNGVPTPIVFLTQGSTWTDTGSKAILSSTGVAVNPNVAGSVFDIAVLNTNTDPTSTLVLKLATDFTVSSTFDLTTPPTGGYGMELTDGTSTHGVDQLERLIVQRVNGAATVELIQANLTTNTQTVVASHTLTAAELANNTQIEFQLSHAANSTAVTGTFELIDNGTVTSTTTFVPTASIFTNGIDWTRVDVGAFTSAGVGLNVGSGQSPREGQTLTASASTNDSGATLHYQWQESSNNFATFTVIGSDSANYVVQESDEGFAIRVVSSTTDPDNGSTASVTSVTTGPVLDALPTVTTPIVTGITQEGQTLTASASAGQSDNPVSYAWYSSADNYTNPIGTGASYLVQETDEGFTIEAKATATNDNGVTISATSLTSAVLDAAPTVTTPTIVGIAQEGQTLTASASSGQSDNPVSYAWYSSADNYTNPIGTGASYLVQETDEGFTIEAKATATNDNGVTISAASAPTASVIDDASISLAVSVVGNGTVQQGQTLVATATVTGDATDLATPVTYQWQTSSNGGADWTNVPATTVGQFNNGVLSSFYQLGEADEGNLFRAVASITDDTGQVVSTTSAPTAPVADVTPEITVPFSYTVTDLSIVKNGTQFYTPTPRESEDLPCQTARSGFYRTDDTGRLSGQRIAARPDRVGSERVGRSSSGPACERAGVAGRWDELRCDCEGAVAGRRHHPHLVSPV